MGVVALAGLVAAASSTWVHHQVLTDPGYASFCDVSSSLSCTNAYTSRYGSFAGVSVALLGALLLRRRVAAASPSAWPRGGCARTSPATCSWRRSSALAGVFYLAYASLVVLKTVCLLCVATYVAVTGLFVSAAVATRVPMRTLPARLAADVSHAAAHAGSGRRGRGVRRAGCGRGPLVPGRGGCRGVG